MAYLTPEAMIGQVGGYFNNTQFFGTAIILHAAIIVGILLLITREPQRWKELALPVTIALTAAGMHTSPLLIVISVILFAVSSMSMKVITTTFGGVGETFQKTQERARKDTNWNIEKNKYEQWQIDAMRKNKEWRSKNAITTEQKPKIALEKTIPYEQLGGPAKPTALNRKKTKFISFAGGQLETYDLKPSKYRSRK